jgi:hypothetical protein
MKTGNKKDSIKILVKRTKMKKVKTEVKNKGNFYGKPTLGKTNPHTNLYYKNLVIKVKISS